MKYGSTLKKKSSCKDDSSISKKKIDEVEYIDN